MRLSHWRAFEYPDAFYRVWITGSNDGLLVDGSKDYAAIVGRGFMGTDVEGPNAPMDTWGFRTYRPTSEGEPFLIAQSSGYPTKGAAMDATERLLKDYETKEGVIYRHSVKLFRWLLLTVTMTMTYAFAMGYGEQKRAISYENAWILLVMRYGTQSMQVAATDAISDAVKDRITIAGKLYGAPNASRP